MDEEHTLNALAYVEVNPVRAGMVEHAWEYPWSSASAHCNERVADKLLNLTRWRSHFGVEEWQQTLCGAVSDDVMAEKIRAHTRRGRPLGKQAYFQRKLQQK